MSGEDWLEPDDGEHDDWIDRATRKPEQDLIVPEVPQTATLVAAAELPVEYGERLQVVGAAWAALSDKQRQFLSAWRECRLNGSKAERVLGISHSTVMSWRHNKNFETVRAAWRADAGGDALNRDRLLARHDDIVETLLTPKPVLHQGLPTGHFEVEAGGAARANETLMKVAGMLKEDKVDINVGLVGPSLIIQVMQPAGGVIDVTPRNVPVPELAEPADEDWLGT